MLEKVFRLLRYARVERPTMHQLAPSGSCPMPCEGPLHLTEGFLYGVQIGVVWWQVLQLAVPLFDEIRDALSGRLSESISEICQDRIETHWATRVNVT